MPLSRGGKTGIISLHAEVNTLQQLIALLRTIEPSIVFPVITVAALMMFFLYYKRASGPLAGTAEWVAYHLDRPKRFSLSMRCPMEKADAAPLIVIIVVFLFLALWVLGDTAAPQSFHQFTKGENSITVDLGKEEEIGSLMFYTGLWIGNYKLEFAGRDENWVEQKIEVEPVEAEKKEAETKGENNGGNDGGNDGAASSTSSVSSNSTSSINVGSGSAATSSSGSSTSTPSTAKQSTSTPSSSASPSSPSPAMDQPHSHLFKWRSAILNKDNAPVRYIRITSSRTPMELGELAIYRKDGGLITAAELKCPDAPELFDEQELIPGRATYMNSMYFDEIYHGRTAYEFLRGIYPYETTHPPLGKEFIALSVAVFGMTPFGWRFIGAILGVLMLAIMYILLKNMFGKTVIATCATFLFGFDFMRYTQTRIATIDTYAVLFILLAYYFMYRYLTNALDTPLRKTIAPLALSGLFFGIGCASKWVVVYAGVGLAVIYVIRLVLYYRYCDEQNGDYKRSNNDNNNNISEYIQSNEINEFNKHNGYREQTEQTEHSEHSEHIENSEYSKHIENGERSENGEHGENSEPGEDNEPGRDDGQNERNRHNNDSEHSEYNNRNRNAGFVVYMIRTILLSVVFFGIVPVVIYCLSYIPYGWAKDMTIANGMLRNADFYKIIWENQVSMLSYHGKLVATHPYSAYWWQWVLDIRPILYFNTYTGNMRSSFAAFGNPLVWWGGLLAMIAMAYRVVRHKDFKALFILIGYLSQIVPWIPITRVLFIYHYFPSTVFLVLALGHVFNTIHEKERGRYLQAIYGYTAATGALFVVFFPTISGVSAPQWYFKYLLKWIPGWWPM